MAINFSNVTAITLGVDDVLQIQDSLGTVLWQKTVPLENYFYIEDISGQTNTLSIVKGGSSAPTIEPYVSTDQQTWVSMGTTSTTPITYTIPANTKLYIKCNTNKWGYSYLTGNTISASGRHNVGGNIMSLLYSDDFENKVTYSQNGTFNRLFYSDTNLVNASDLLLPATTLTTDCYTWTFNSCSSMVTAPAVLPATTLTGGCYQGMFEGTAITETPVIYGTNSMAYTFSYTFDNCPNLNKVYVYLTGNQKNTSNINNWLANVAATGDFYNLGGATFTIDSPSGIPVGWTEHRSLPVPCNVSISSNGNGSVSVNGVSGDYSDTVMSDTQLTLVATPDAGYYFTGWSDGDSNASRTIIVTGDLTLTASFAVIVNYNVSVSAGSNGTVSVNGVTGNYSQSVAVGTTLTLAATADSGYMFDEWSDNVSTNPRTVTVNSNLTLTASFVVEYQRNNQIWYETNNNQTADFSNTGFNGTQTSNTYSNNKGVAAYSGNITSTSGNNSSSRATNLTKISFPDTLTSIGQHSFDGCPLTELDFNNVTSVGYEAFDNNHIQHLHIPATLTTITNNPFRSSTITQITVDANNPNYNDGSSHNGSNCIYSGTTLMCGCVNTVIPDNCTIIGDWSMSNNYSLTTVSLPATVTQIKQYAFAGDTTVPVTTLYARSNPSFGTQPFMGWQTNGTLYYTSGVNYSTWLSKLPSGWTAVRLCDVTVSAGNNGSVSVNGTSGNYHQSELPSGTQLTLVATPAAGYQFDSWSDGDTNASRTVTITADTTLTASFVQQIPTYNVTITAGNNGTVSVNGVSGNYSQSVQSGTQLTIAATANNGYEFDEWSDNVSTNPRTITITGNTTLTASFVQQQPVGDYFYIEDASGANNTVSIKLSASNGTPVEFFSRTGNTNWTSMGTTSTTPITATVPANSKLYLKANPSNYTLGTAATGNIINCSGDYNVGGYVNSLLEGDNYATNRLHTIAGNNQIYHLHFLFKDDTHLLSAANLVMPTNTGNACYAYMFWNCTSLTSTPALPATTLSPTCYQSMFNGCTALTTAPVLMATTLANGCYGYMFQNCTSLTSTPVLPATTLADSCYMQMFNHCTSLNSVTTYANDISASNCTNYWLNDVAATGDFYNYGSATYTIDSPNGIPQGWTEHKPYSVNIVSSDNDYGTVSVNGVSGDYSAAVMSGTQLALVATPDSGYDFDMWSDGNINASRTITVTSNLTLTASFVQQQPVGDYFYIEDVSGRNGTLRIIKNNLDAPTIEVFSSTDGTNWSSMGTTDKTSTSSMSGVEIPDAITAAIPANGKLYLKATTDQWGTIDPYTGDLYNSMKFSRNCNVGGNIMSLLYGDNFDEYPELDNNYGFQFMHLFHNNTRLVDASNLILPSNTGYGYLPQYCFYGMFSGCTRLTAAPELPALELGEGSYKEMFNGCTTLDTIVCYCKFNDMPDCTYNWLYGVAQTGDFYNYGQASFNIGDPSAIPEGWTEHWPDE